MKTNAQLPPQEAERLRELRAKTDPAALYARVLVLRAKGWPLRAIGEPLSVSRMGVRSWQLRAENDLTVLERLSDENDVPDLPLHARGSDVRPARVVPQVPKEDADRMRELSVLVRDIRGGTPQDSPARTAADELYRLLDHHINERGVPAQHVANEVGVTRRAIMARLEGYAKRNANAA